MFAAQAISTIYNNFIGFLFVLGRTTGIFTFNPIFARSNVPNNIKALMSLAMAVVTTVGIGPAAAAPEFDGIIGFTLVLMKELLVGFVFGFFTNLILTVMMYAGEVIDTEVGLGMAKAYDPATGVTMPVFGNYYYYLFVLYFFVTDTHLSYIRLFKLSFDTIPIGYEFTSATLDLTYIIVMYFGTVMELAVKFAMPILAAELITELVIGIMMKAIPTIQIFVVNIQLKLIIGFIILIAMARPVSEFMEKLLGILWENLYTAATHFV